ncbi:MAG TPA: methyltransferase domain-containing protein [Candidatus Acidoferrales bacterium]|nr:methyltransferase domain-containing protein [Candidatus Acidoferrales bacterium]
MHVADTTGCRILGLDSNEAGVRNGNRLAAERGMQTRVHFEDRDVSEPLPFDDVSFDSAFANDVLCHIPDRAALLAEIIRVLKPGARLLFSDALVIGGMVTHHELATRSSIGLYVFTPPGENERLIKETGFRLIASRDTTVNAALIAKRWRDSREKRKNELIAVEGDPTFRDLQEFLSCVHALTKERRLLRYLYVAQKPKRPQARRRKNR